MAKYADSKAVLDERASEVTVPTKRCALQVRLGKVLRSVASRLVERRGKWYAGKIGERKRAHVWRTYSCGRGTRSWRVVILYAVLFIIAVAGVLGHTLRDQARART
jgi:hypothetical protein